MKELFLIRGVSGAGKSTLAKSIGGVHYEADMYFMEDGGYQFDVTRLKDAHQWCQDSVEEAMTWDENPEIEFLSAGVSRIVVSNTFTQEWEMKPYFNLAKKYGYKTYSLIVENRHNGVNEHGVPEDKLELMRKRFEISL
jgi:ABC-type molybdenum transport system ATPase subunit/photorepair protein PhrA